jgi:hypothetical protein
MQEGECVFRALWDDRPLGGGLLFVGMPDTEKATFQMLKWFDGNYPSKEQNYITLGLWMPKPEDILDRNWYVVDMEYLDS